MAREDFQQKPSSLPSPGEDLWTAGSPPALDDVLGGLGRGRLTVLAGRPDQGKTSLALTIAQTGEAHPNENAALSAMSRGLKQLATGLEIPVLLLSQLSREPERRGGEARPRLSDLRGSGAIEQNADAVVFLWNQIDLPGDGCSVEALIAKNRHGWTDDIGLHFEKAIMRFRERDPGQGIRKHGT